MSNPELPPRPTSSELRDRAERRLKLTRMDIASMNSEDIQAVVHELQVHQIELEIQNEDLRQAQQELAQTRDRFMDLYQSAPVGYLTLDAQRVIRQANQTAATLLGMELGKLAGMHLESLVAREDSDAGYVCMRQALDSGQPQRAEVRFRKSDGSFFLGRHGGRPRPAGRRRA